MVRSTIPRSREVEDVEASLNRLGWRPYNVAAASVVYRRRKKEQEQARLQMIEALQQRVQELEGLSAYASTNRGSLTLSTLTAGSLPPPPPLTMETMYPDSRGPSEHHKVLTSTPPGGPCSQAAASATAWDATNCLYCGLDFTEFDQGKRRQHLTRSHRFNDCRLQYKGIKTLKSFRRHLVYIHCATSVYVLRLQTLAESSLLWRDDDVMERHKTAAAQVPGVPPAVQSSSVLPPSLALSVERGMLPASKDLVHGDTSDSLVADTYLRPVIQPPAMAATCLNPRFTSNSVGDSSRTPTVVKKKCSECGGTDTPQWRCGPDGTTLCNTCGLRYAKQKRPRMDITYLPLNAGWLSFNYPRGRVTMEHNIRCDVESVDQEELSAEFKMENCLYPRACCPKEQYRAHRL